MKKWWFLKKIMCLKSRISDRELYHLEFMLQNLQETSTHRKKEKDNLKRYIVWKARKGKHNRVPFKRKMKVNVRVKKSSRNLSAPEHISPEPALCVIYSCSAAISPKWLLTLNGCNSPTTAMASEHCLPWGSKQESDPSVWITDCGKSPDDQQRFITGGFLAQCL